ncbi:MAG: hypothetical protein RM368_26450 [Nostoc sp. DedSLP03]|uniref:hypothetical protein n=1 Tax=Nostoc sp. DedSLP03 TaxID=3075400 RepID=UPI002AD316AA|nr:hypothetical protein [Nostoc sp. DedSLP03]MDZ7968449.1 hypothetical protein [Nostoc sp. DedSLP03]
MLNSDAQVELSQDIVETTAVHAVPKTIAQSTENASKPTEKQKLFSPTPADDKLSEELTTGQQPGHPPVEEKPLEPPKVEPQVTGKRNKKKIDSPPATKPYIPFQDRLEEPELPPEPCQHMQFLDCNLEVGRVIFECYHCQQGIISEYTGDPLMGEYKGRPSVIFTKVKCPNCEQTAIRLQAREVLSITAIPSPWAEK